MSHIDPAAVSTPATHSIDITAALQSAAPVQRPTNGQAARGAAA
ncbi:hypothetical protein [Leifsonia sp. NCR5]|nr:hypothetical protein [Leifsonia sp. NCR5]